ncbi:MAG: 30S ribosomal protein S8 [Candidatus Vogelbacteria bacterium]|jgi:small subunit ribosomal protein S8|nr:30S ribosomal protein S8 [Candidatus Vogelbacteria bacterium]
MTTDPISNMLVTIKNASMVKKPFVVVPYSNLKMAIAEVLVKEGYLTAANKRGKKVKKFIQCDIAYEAGKSKLTTITRISKPSRRVYKRVVDLRSVRQGQGIAVLTTPQGVMTEKEAKVAKVGGELLFTLW